MWEQACSKEAIYSFELIFGSTVSCARQGFSPNFHKKGRGESENDASVNSCAKICQTLQILTLSFQRGSEPNIWTASFFLKSSKPEPNSLDGIISFDCSILINELNRVCLVSRNLAHSVNVQQGTEKRTPHSLLMAFWGVLTVGTDGKYTIKLAAETGKFLTECARFTVLVFFVRKKTEPFF